MKTFGLLIVQIYRLFLFLLMITFLQSCDNKNKKITKKTDLNSKAFQDKLIEANKMYVKKESDEIDQYILHRGWEMLSTGTGLRYMITEKGSGEAVVVEKQVKVDYRISLLDGTLCYSSDSIGPKVFVVGMDNVETGLHEGIQLLHVGDKAVFILPSHLAHGLLGDDHKIPPRSTVVYNIDLLDMH